MFLSNSLKPLAVFCLSIAVLGACTPSPDVGNAGASPTPVEAPEFPFSVAEPEVFQAEIVVTANGLKRHLFVARDRANYRTDYDLDSEDRRAVIRGEKNYLVSYKERIYAEEPAAAVGDVSGSDDPDAGLLLGQRVHADLVKTGDEGGLEKYEGRVEGDETSRVAVWFDPAAKTIVREEIYGTAVYSMELRNFKLEAPAGLFAPPPDFWQVTPDEFRKLMRR
jgi:hypothetical protein